MSHQLTISNRHLQFTAAVSPVATAALAEVPAPKIGSDRGLISAVVYCDPEEAHFFRNALQLMDYVDAEIRECGRRVGSFKGRVSYVGLPEGERTKRLPIEVEVM